MGAGRFAALLPADGVVLVMLGVIHDQPSDHFADRGDDSVSQTFDGIENQPSGNPISHASQIGFGLPTPP
jgi:hypothetical protein